MTTTDSLVSRYTSSGFGAWPLTPTDHFPGERSLTCPRCFRQESTLTTHPPAVGTGPGGRPRMGDPGSRDVVICGHCNLVGYLPG